MIKIGGGEYSSAVTELDLSAESLASEDIKDIGSIRELNRLYMPENKLTDISALEPLKELNILYLQYNNISDITPVSRLEKLSDLKLNNNLVKDITPLRGLKNLKSLSLQNNSISDITPLKALTGLERLYLDGNPVSAEDIEALKKALPKCVIDCAAAGTVTVTAKKSKKPVILALAAAAAIAAAALGAMRFTRDADELSVSDTEITEEISETAAPAETETETAAETSATTAETTTTAATTTASETTTVPVTTTAAETTTETETATTPETTTAPPFTSYVPVKYNYSVPDIVPLYMREEYNKAPEQYFPNVTFDIDDEELLYLTVNAHFIRCELFWGGNSWSIDPELELKEIPIKFDTDERIYYVWNTGISFQSFIDYASTVFTQDYITNIQQPDRYDNVDWDSGINLPDTRFGFIVNINDQLYESHFETGINTSYDRTIYHVHVKTEDKVTIVRETAIADMDHAPEDPEYKEPPHTYYYMDLVKTPDGWRFDDFPMYDDWRYDVYSDGTLAYPNLY